MSKLVVITEDPCQRQQSGVIEEILTILKAKGYADTAAQGDSTDMGLVLVATVEESPLECMGYDLIIGVQIGVDVTSCERLCIEAPGVAQETVFVDIHELSANGKRSQQLTTLLEAAGV